MRRLLDYFKNPLVTGIVGGLLGLFFGLVVLGWNFWPVEWTKATPAALSEEHQEDYLRMAIDSFEKNGNADLAWIRIQQVGVDKSLPILQKIAEAPGQQNPGIALNFRDRVASVASAPTQPETGGEATDAGGEPTAGEEVTPLAKIVIYGVVAVLVLFGAVAAIYFGRKFLAKREVAPEDYTPARQAQEINKVAAEARTDFSKLGLQEPTSRTMTTYVLGDDLYDESFSIDAQSGEFLGEYGVGVSEAIGVGEPKKVTAIEIWLFDKNDIKTATKVLMTPHAFNDPNLRSKLEAKGELVMIEPHGQVLLETQTLQLLATAVDLEFGQSNPPNKSYFDRITLELAVWPK